MKEDTLEIPKEKKAKKDLPQIIHNLRIVIAILDFFSPKLAAKLAFHIYARPRKSKKKLKDPILDAASIFYLPYNNGKIKVYSWGASDRRVLLMHGWESKATTFREMIPVLLEKGFAVVAMDAPAHGGSSGTTTNFIDWGEAVVEVISYYDCLDLPIKNVVSHSFGGSATLHMLNRGEIALEKFVTISSPIFFYSYYNDFCKLFAVSEQAQKHMLLKMDGILGTSFLDFDLSNNAHMASVDSMLMVHDQDDPVITMAHINKMRERFDKPEYLITQGLGHYFIIKDREVIEKTARFLSDTC